jgi:NADPH-dependent glutamate synthase beta subunit-like oxidoreductase/Pyruvate/2-oxoacid:ferredoxin oxidoreductase delta subunit
MTPEPEATRPRADVAGASSLRPRQVEKQAPCQTGCANSGDIRAWIGAVAQRGKTGASRQAAYERAWRIITEANPFPAVLGRICPHPCEAHCNRAEKDGAVAINALERFLGDWAIEQHLPLASLEQDSKPESVGVIGAGPSGLSFAYQLARRGYAVTVYEGRPEPGGMLRYGIPDYRLPSSVLLAEIRRILDLGVQLELNTRVGQDISVQRLRSRHEILYLGIGAQAGRLLGVPGEEEPGVWVGTEYLRRIKEGDDIYLGHHVAVIGGGDTAVDAARTARRHGSQATILYRRTREEMPAVPKQVEEALAEGVRLELLVAPISIQRREGTVVGLQAQRMRLGERDETDRRRPLPVPGSEHLVAVDAVIVAVSQKPDWVGLDGLGISDGWLGTDEAGILEDGWWAGGDVLGLGIAGMAIAHGRHAAEAVHAKLRGMEPRPASGGASIGADRIKTDLFEPCSPVSPAQLSPEEAISHPVAEVSLGITEDQFLAEVGRCFSCGLCFGCEHCWMYCTPLCFTRVEEAEPGAYFTLALEMCEECGKCVDVCPGGYLEFE